MSVRLIKISTVYLLVGVALGVVMSFIKDTGLSSLYSQLLVLGWGSLAVIGGIYQLFPSASATSLAKGHFWLHNVGLPILVVGVFLDVVQGNSVWDIIATIGTCITALGLILFVINVFANLKASK